MRIHTLTIVDMDSWEVVEDHSYEYDGLVARCEGFLGIGGSQQKTNRKIQLQGYQDLSNIFNYAIPTSQNLMSTGTGTTGQATNYWSQILSGNRPAALQAMAPETNSVLSGADAARRQAAASGTARGGGTASTNQQAKTTTQATVDNALFGARSDAAKSLAQTGNAETADALNALGLGSNIAGELFTGPGSSTDTGASNGSAIGSTIANGLLDAFGLAV